MKKIDNKLGRFGWEFCRTLMENEKMKLLAYARLINKKINSANSKARNPFLDYSMSYNPFKRPIYNTLVWVESDTKENGSPDD